MRLIARPLALIALAIAALSAATAEDLVGSWVVDADATWAAWQDRPELAKVPADMREKVKRSVIAKASQMAIEITPTEMTRSDAGTSETSLYKVLSSEGDTVTIESSASDGKKTKGRMELHDGRLRVTGVDDSGAATQGVLVLRRRTAEDGAKPTDAAKDEKPAAPAKPAEDAPAKVVTTPTE